MMLRRLLKEKYKARGNGVSNLWLVKSYRMQKQWVLSSDAEYLHFLWVEFDPNVIRFDLAPEEIIVNIGQEYVKTQFDGVVTLKGGRLECREIKADVDGKEQDVRTLLQREAQTRASTLLGGTYVRLFGTVLVKKAHAIANSMRMLRTIHAAENFALEEHRQSIYLRVNRATAGLSIGEILERWSSEESPLALAALFQLLSRQQVLIKIDDAPICLATKVRIAHD